jgi:hypothetical protein
VTPERAQEIVTAINNLAFFAMGMAEPEKTRPLGGVSLAEMIEATRMVAARNEAPAIDGKKTIHVVPAERLIAAAFVLSNYEGNDEAIVAHPLRGFLAGCNRVVVVADIEQKAGEEEEEEAA